MNNITDLLDLEDSDIKISDIIIEGQTKTLIIETPPVASYCPICGFRMHSRGVKKRTINHPILQDGYSLILLLKQRRWRCSNPDCLYEVNESFRFVNKGRRTTNATDMLIVEAYRNLLETSASIAKRFHMSDTYVHEIFDRYVKLDRLPLTDAISIDEVHLDMDDDCKYALVIQDFHTSNPIDLLRSRRTSVTEPYFVSIPATERNQVKYLISDMYNPYIAYVEKYFPNAMENYCAFSKNHTCLKWLDYVITRQELEEADSLCHGNWIEIQRKNQYIQPLLNNALIYSFPDFQIRNPPVPNL